MKINTLPVKLRTTLLAIIALSVIVTLSVFALAQNRDASAADARNFDPGNIISDAVFYNSGAMSASQIQSFLNARVPNCDTNGTGMAVEWGRPDISRATLASYIRNGTNGYTRDTAFHAPPYVCLKNFRQDTPQMAAASGLCGGISARSNASSAQILSDIARACGINPQVLLVLLQKEQSLVTDIWPLQRQYRGATGFACPDTAPCDPKYNGFFYQVYYAARQFKIYQAYPNSYNYLAGRSNRVYWQTNLGNYINPTGNQNDPSRTGKSACGYQNVYIQNQATAALYIYTPYQPNQRAMANLYGTGDFCSAYGNRNFWRMFTDWFGSTRENYVYRSENLVGSSGAVINKTTQATKGISTTTIGEKIYTFYGDSSSKTLRLAEWNGSRWSDRAIDGTGSVVAGSISNIDTDHVISFEYRGWPQVYYYDKTTKSLRHAFISRSGNWATETLDGTASSVLNRTRDVGSAISGFKYGPNGIQLYYHNNGNESLEHTWWDGREWRTETLDGTASSVLKRTRDVGSAVSGSPYKDGIQLFYYDQPNGELIHTWWSSKNQQWRTEKMDGDTGSVLKNYINAGKAIETAVFNNRLFVIYYDDATGFSGRTSAWRAAYWGGNSWVQHILDGGNSNSQSGSAANIPLAEIGVAPYNNQSLQIFYKGNVNQVRHFWINKR